MDLVKAAQDEGGYQPIMVGGKQVSEGWRECFSRWEHIEPYIPADSTILDIGSHYGFFALQSAVKQPTSFIWSIEENRERASIQREMLEINQIPNIVLSQHKWTIDTTEKLLSTCFTADVILLLSVGHYFDRETMPQMFANLAKLSPTLIIEWPSKEELEVASRDLIQNTDIDKLLGDNYDSVEIIAHGRSPKHKNVDRNIYRASNDTIYMAKNKNLKRGGLTSHIGGQIRNHTVAHVGKSNSNEAFWLIDENHRRWPGMTLDDLRHFSMIYPNPLEVLNSAAHAYDELILQHDGNVTDVNIRNVVASADGLHIIDCTEGLGREYIYDMPITLYKIRTLDRARQQDFHLQEFVEMWNGTWKP